ncbi:DNA-binding protein [Halobacteriales archaeon QH_8_64_26]|nr:MAG: DNA-binding protein [Halobacteriales archaeon QH_8_64_26]
MGESESMSTVAEFRVPVEGFALERTLSRIPKAEFDIERAVPVATDRVMVVLWAHGPDYEELRTALEADPAVADFQGLVDLDVEWLYQMHWTDGLHVLRPALAEHDGTLMHAYGDREGWHLRVLVLDRGAVAALAEWCEAEGLTLEIDRIYDLDERLGERYSLSESQYEALALAYERGYFESPRGVSATELAADLGISQQALSERLRRASQNLLDETLATDDPPAAFSYPDRWQTRRS